MSGSAYLSRRADNLGDLIRPDVPADRPALIDLAPPRPAAGAMRELDVAAEASQPLWCDAPLADGARVAILAENCAEYLIAYMGTMRAGCVSRAGESSPAASKRCTSSSPTALRVCASSMRPASALLPAGLPRMRDARPRRRMALEPPSWRPEQAVPRQRRPAAADRRDPLYLGFNRPARRAWCSHMPGSFGR